MGESLQKNAEIKQAYHEMCEEVKKFHKENVNPQTGRFGVDPKNPPDDMHRKILHDMRTKAYLVERCQQTLGCGPEVEDGVLQDIYDTKSTEGRRLVQTTVSTSPNSLDLGLATGSMLLGFL